MKRKKIAIHIVVTAILLFILSQLFSCTFLEGFQFGNPGSEETATTGENGPVDLDKSDNSVSNESDDLSEISDDDDFPGSAIDEDSQDGQSYVITPADRKGMKNKIETSDLLSIFANFLLI